MILRFKIFFFYEGIQIINPITIKYIPAFANPSDNIQSLNKRGGHKGKDQCEPFPLTIDGEDQGGCRSKKDQPVKTFVFSFLLHTINNFSKNNDAIAIQKKSFSLLMNSAR